MSNDTDFNEKSNSPNVIPFGKYRGHPIEVLSSDKDYTDWLMAQPWFRERYGNMYTLIVNNFGEPGETPEHNALQAMFLDGDFCHRVVRRLGVDLLGMANANLDWLRRSLQNKQESLRIIQEIFAAEAADYQETLLSRSEEPSQEWLAKIANDPDRDQQIENSERSRLWLITHQDKRFQEKKTTMESSVLKTNNSIDEIKAKIEENKVIVSQIENGDLPADLRGHREFEVGGWDVIMRADKDPYKFECRIELKPTLGDDYPAVLRQMKANCRGKDPYAVWHVALIIGECVAVGAKPHGVAEKLGTSDASSS
jgi:hypothetical protein